MKGKYKVIYQYSNMGRGENYSGKTHSLKEAKMIVDEGKGIHKKYYEPVKFKIVKVRPTNPMNVYKNRSDNFWSLSCGKKNKLRF